MPCSSLKSRLASARWRSLPRLAAPLTLFAPLSAASLVLLSACGETPGANDDPPSSPSNPSAQSSTKGSTGAGNPQSPSVVPANPEQLAKQAEGLKTVPIKSDAKKAISRLTRSQYIHSVEALLGADAASGLGDTLPELTPDSGYGNSGHAQSQPYELVVAYDIATKQVVSNIDDWTAVFDKYSGCSELPCISDFVRSFGEAAFRRPLSDEEVSALDPILSAAQGLSYQETVELLVRALLQAPEFLYQFESSKLDAYQLASRLAFFVSDGPPDAELYSLAKNGTIADPAVLEAQADRLLNAHGRRFAEAFAYDYFALRRSGQRTFGVSPELVPKLVESAVQSFADLVATDAPLADVLTTTTFAVNSETAAYVRQPTSSETLTSSDAYPFMGLLTHPAVLLAMSNAVEGSTVSRGLFVAGQLLCFPPTPPPPIAFSPEDAGELPLNPTPRQEAEARLANPQCSGCHSQFESLSFGLIQWGGDGIHTQNIRRVDDGTISTPLGEMEFSGYAEFLTTVSKSEQFQTCLSDHLLRYGLRHTDYPAETRAAVLQAAHQGGKPLTFRSVIKAIVLQVLFAQH